MAPRMVWVLWWAAVLGICQTALAGVALEVNGTPFGSPADSSNHGWEFVANSPITVSRLGLFDYNNDGFAIDRPIGLFRLGDAALLTSGTIHAGDAGSRTAGSCQPAWPMSRQLSARPALKISV